MTRNVIRMRNFKVKKYLRRYKDIEDKTAKSTEKNKNLKEKKKKRIKIERILKKDKEI